MKFTPSMMGAASGKLGGVVASRNRNGQYFRRNAMPVNPQTSRQTSNRTNFSTWVNEWILLTSGDKSTWNAWAANIPYLDSLGQVYYLSGQQAYLRAHAALVSGGPGPFQTAPAALDNGVPPLDCTEWTLGATAGTIDYTFTIGGSGTSEEGALAIYVSRPQSVGKTFFKGPYQLGIVNGGVNQGDNAVTANDIATLMEWQLLEDEYVHIRARFIYSDGRVSPTWQGWKTVGPNVP